MGLLFLPGLAVMVLALYVAARVTQSISLKVGLGKLQARLASAAILIAIVAVVNIENIRTLQVENDVCRHRVGRNVARVERNVVAVRFVGSLEDLPDYMYGTANKYDYIEWEAPPLKWRRNIRSADVCGAGQSCNIDAFSSNFELRIKATHVSTKLVLVEQQVVDVRTGEILGSDNSLNVAATASPSFKDIFLFWWQIPAMALLPLIKTCTGPVTSDFVTNVLVPK